MAISNDSSSFYQDGGALPPSSPSYVRRRADEDLYRYLKAGEFCYVLTSRQMGKSSLRIHTTERLVAAGLRCANIDLTSIGSKNITHEQWYYGLLSKTAQDLGIPRKDLEGWWRNNLADSPVRRFTRYIDEVVLTPAHPTVIMIDEVDLLLAVDAREFSADDFLAAIRLVYNHRAEDPRYHAVTFCLFGVAAPDDLMRSPERTPFNIGKAIELGPLEPNECLRLLKGIRRSRLSPPLVLERVLFWTGGQPYLTQKLLKLIEGRTDTIVERGDIDDVVARHFLTAKKQDSNLLNINNRILLSDSHVSAMLEVLEQIIAGKLVHADAADEGQAGLLLSGLVVEADTRLVYANRIYQAVFGREWLARALDKVTRPFSTDLIRWLDLGKSRAAALRGAVLDRALEWAEGRTDLSPAEHEYLRFCQVVHEEEVRLALQAEHGLRIRSKNRLLAGLALAFAVTAVVATFLSVRAASHAQRARAAELQANLAATRAAEEAERAIAEERRANQERAAADRARFLATKQQNRADSEEERAQLCRRVFEQAAGSWAAEEECRTPLITWVNENEEFMRAVFEEDFEPLQTRLQALKRRNTALTLAGEEGYPEASAPPRDFSQEGVVADTVAEAARKEDPRGTDCGFTIPQATRDKYPALTNMILLSESMECEERFYWLQVLPVMRAAHVAELYDILDSERRRLKAIEGRYELMRKGESKELDRLEGLLEETPEDSHLDSVTISSTLLEVGDRHLTDPVLAERVEKIAIGARDKFASMEEYDYFLARLYMRLQRWSSASSASQRVIAANGYHFGAQTIAARALFEQRNPKGALPYYKNALRLATNFAEILPGIEMRDTLGVLMVQSANALSQSDDQADAHGLLMRGLELLREFRVASKSSESARLQAWGLLVGATLSSRAGNYSVALSYAQERTALLEDCGCVLASQRAGAYGSLAWYQVLARSFADAVSSARKGLEISGGEKWIEGNLAHGLLLSGQHEDAERIYLKYLGETIYGGREWSAVVLEDFRTLREAGIRSPELDRIEALLRSPGT